LSDPVRELLIRAQALETQGDKAEAAKLLLKAATLYEDTGRAARAEQMRRHAARLKSEDGGASARRSKPVMSKPALAAGASSAKCSFCRRPKSEAGKLVASPTGVFICGDCLEKSLALLRPNPRSR
jgi:hypothetical protein